MSREPFPILPAADRDRVTVHDACGRAIGSFALRGLCDHNAGQRLAAAVGGPRQARFPGPHGLVEDVALVDPGALDRVFAAIARRALARMYGTIFFCGGEHRLAAALAALGVDAPGELAAVGALPVIGVYEPARPSNLARLRALELAPTIARAA